MKRTCRTSSRSSGSRKRLRPRSSGGRKRLRPRSSGGRRRLCPRSSGGELVRHARNALAFLLLPGLQVPIVYFLQIFSPSAGRIIEIRFVCALGPSIHPSLPQAKPFCAQSPHGMRIAKWEAWKIYAALSVSLPQPPRFLHGIRM